MTNEQDATWVKPGIQRIGAARQADGGNIPFAAEFGTASSPSGPT
jgi:hypothetical protein